MEHTAKDASPKFIPVCTLPLTGMGVIDKIVTDLDFFERADHASPFHLVELAPTSRQRTSLQRRLRNTWREAERYCQIREW